MERVGSDERWIEVQGMSESDEVVWVESFEHMADANVCYDECVANGERVRMVGLFPDGDIFEYDRNY